MLKMCCHCKSEKPLEGFYPSRNGRNAFGVMSKCKDCTKAANKAYAKANPEKRKILKARDVEKHYEKRQKTKENWRKVNPDKVAASAAKSHAKHRAEMTNYYIGKLVRHRMWMALNGLSKSEKTLNLLGCSIEQLRAHLAARFTEGMSWTNYGRWEIDHIRPCASFDLMDAAQQAACFHFTNLRPMWANGPGGNRSKGKKVL